MSKMDRMLNSKKEKQTIYEIYRACRLCGAGGGYKMPIIQNMDLDDTDVELKQKIRECVQIEVHQDDKMPPLICELCVDKVNDFYEFLEMCRQTNKRTRLRLGLPPQSLPGGAPDAGDCILGLTEPVYVNEDSDGEPLSKQKKTSKSNVKVKKEPQVKVEPRSSRLSKREPTPPRTLRNSRNSRDDSSFSRSQERSSKPSPKVSPKSAPKSILKKTEDTSLLSPRLKRTRDREPVKIDIPVKKVKIAIKPVSPPRSKSRDTKQGKSKSSPPRTHKCDVCHTAHKTPQALASHMRTHAPVFINVRQACNPCREWFTSVEEATIHHRQHRSKSKPYHCQRCDNNYNTLSAYDEHIASSCSPWPVVPDAKCESCWHMFATTNLLDAHRCLGEDHRPGGKCSKCNRSYALLKNLKKHESTCTAKKKGAINPALLAKVKPLQIRMSRCDPLLLNVKQEHYDVSSVAADYGLDKNCVYPYTSKLRIKSELDTFRGMVSINEEIKKEFCEKEYVHWDSDDSQNEEDEISLLPTNKKIDSLTVLALKTIFSRKCLGRVPRKRRKVKQENFDSIVEADDDVTRDINNIIDNLGNDDFDDVDVIDRSDDHNSKGDGDDSKTNESLDDKNDESSKLNSLDKESKDNGTVNNSGDVDDEKSKNDDDIVDNERNNKNVDDDSSKDDKESEGSNENDCQTSDGIQINDKVSEECENNNENSDVNAKNDYNSSIEGKDIINDDSLKSKDTSDDHKNNKENGDDHKTNDENGAAHKTNDENSDEHQVNDDKGDDHNKIDEHSGEHQINDENGDNPKINDDNNDDHRMVDIKENRDNDDDKNNDAQNENQISKDITNDKQNDDNSNDFQANLDTNDNTNLEESTDISKLDKSDNYQDDIGPTDNLLSIESKNNDSETNVDNDDLLSKLGKSDNYQENKDATDNLLTKEDKNDDFQENVEGSDDLPSNVGTNDNYQDNVDDTDNLLSKTDKNNDCQENLGDNDQVNNESSENSQIAYEKNDEKALLGDIDSQDSNSLTFNENLLKDDLTNECVNEENKLKTANEEFSQETNLNEKSAENVNLNGDSDVFDKTVDNDRLKNEEIDDSNLMAALDAQIGDSESSDVPEKSESYGFNDKIALEDLISEKNNTKPIDMDILPDEFNFDN